MKDFGENFWGLEKMRNIFMQKEKGFLGVAF